MDADMKELIKAMREQTKTLNAFTNAVTRLVDAMYIWMAQSKEDGYEERTPETYLNGKKVS